MEEIEKVRKAEDENYCISRGYLGDSVTLIEDLVGLYSLLGEFIKSFGAKPNDESVSAAQFLLACRYQLVVSALAVMRGHLNDSFLFTRKAIELCAFAARVTRHPHLAQVWVLSGDDEESYRTYREKFRPGSLFPEDHKILGRLKDRYDMCSKFSHPSLFSFGRHLEVETKENEFNLKFDYFQLGNDDPSEPARTFLWVVDTHLGIIKVFEETFSGVVDHDRPGWESHIAAFEARLSAAKGKWKSMILGGSTLG